MGSTEGSYEYLVFNSTFLGVAKKHGLTPLVDWGDPDLDACFEEAIIPCHLFDFCTTALAVQLIYGE